MKRRQFLKGLLATGVVVLAQPELVLPAKPMVIQPITGIAPAMDWYWQQLSGTMMLSGVVPCKVIRSTEYGARYAQLQSNKISNLLQAKMDAFNKYIESYNEKYLKQHMKDLRERQVKQLYGDGSA